MEILAAILEGVRSLEGNEKKLGKLHGRKRCVFEKGNRITSVQAILVGGDKAPQTTIACAGYTTLLNICRGTVLYGDYLVCGPVLEILL